MLRSLSTQSELLKRYMEQQLVATITAAIKGPRKDLRAAAFTSQVLGLVLERDVLGVDPLVAASHDELVALFAPSLQRYLDGPPRV